MYCMLQLGYYFFRTVLSGLNEPIGISIDLTNKCNLRCKHCYFWEQSHPRELSDNNLIKKLREIKKKHPSIIHATWVGGEPLLRKDILRKAMRMFPFNMIVTNGSLPLPKWRNCVFNVSVDGTKKSYELIRGKNTYDRMKKNANRSDVKVNLACTLNTKNFECIDELLAEWSKTKVRGIHFSFYTPIRGIKDKIELSDDQRANIVRQLRKLKKRYGSFILNSNYMLKLMHPKNASKVTSNCPVVAGIYCIDPMGKRKLPCVIGPKADCSQCGCVIPFNLEAAFVKKHLESMLVMWRGYT
jgi:Fe-coproporphyrin III synthase